MLTVTAAPAVHAWPHLGPETVSLRAPKPTITADPITFEANTPSLGELVAPSIRCRHAIGLNHTSIGIEMVQAAGPSSLWADQQIERRKQVGAALRLVRWLQDRYGIPTNEVIGHSMANDDRYFKDLQGWVNDHTDWLKRDVKEFRERL